MQILMAKGVEHLYGPGCQVGKTVSTEDFSSSFESNDLNVVQSMLTAITDGFHNWFEIVVSASLGAGTCLHQISIEGQVLSASAGVVDCQPVGWQQRYARPLEADSYPQLR